MYKQDEYVKTADGAVINTNIEGYEAYKMARLKAVREQEMASKVEKLENEMSDIKSLLISIHNRIG